MLDVIFIFPQVIAVLVGIGWLLYGRRFKETEARADPGDPEADAHDRRSRSCR